MSTVETPLSLCNFILYLTGSCPLALNSSFNLKQQQPLSLAFRSIKSVCGGKHKREKGVNTLQEMEHRHNQPQMGCGVMSCASFGPSVEAWVPRRLVHNTKEKQRDTTWMKVTGVDHSSFHEWEQ